MAEEASPGAKTTSPGVARRRLRLALRQAREDAGRTQLEVAEQMEWSLSKVIRIESGDNTIAPNDLRPLLAYLGVRDRKTVGDLAVMAKIARQRHPSAWYKRAEFRDLITDPMRRLFEYESEAAEARYFSPNLVTGALQTPEYAAALLSRFEEEVDAELVRARLRARQWRHTTVLSRAAAGNMDVRALFDEAVFWRAHGDPAMLADQLRELENLSGQGVIKLRMLRFTDTAAVTSSAGFDLLTLPDAGEVLYRETGLLDETVEKSDVTSRHRVRFDAVWREVADETDTIDFIRERIEHLDASNRRGENSI